MASTITIREDNTKKFMTALQKAKQRGLEAIGLTAEKYAKKAITEQKAVDTGLLRNSITYAISGSQTHVQQYRRDNVSGGVKGKHTYYTYDNVIGDSSEECVYIGTNVEYAPYVENGTSKMAARPFLKPAATEHSDEYKRLFEAALKNG